MPKPITSYTSCEALLVDAIREEQEAAEWYRQAVHISSDPEVQTLLYRLADMEMRHARELTLCLEAVQNQQAVQDGILASFGETGMEPQRVPNRGALHD